MAAPGRHLGTFFGAAAVVLVLDQLTKQWALSALADGPIDLVGSLRLNLVFNDRAAFSLGFGSTTAIALTGCALVGVLLVMGYRAEQRGWALGLGIILGGAFGNLTDRGVEALLANPGLARLERLDIHYHYVSPALVERLRGLGIQVEAGDVQRADDPDDPSARRYIANTE